MYNFVTDEGAVVLVRSLEPIQGQSLMRTMRGQGRNDLGDSLKDYQLCNGPSKLCIAFDIDKSLNKLDLSDSHELWIETDGRNVNSEDIIVSKRIGLDKIPAEWRDQPWRFYIANCRSVSYRDKCAENNKIH